jgi:pimeloyl-ACP methyl ester carboxylesterase
MGYIAVAFTNYWKLGTEKNEQKIIIRYHKLLKMETWISVEEKKNVYAKYGNGKPVVLVHGFGETSTVWEEQIAYLQTKFLLIVPELPGSGQSPMIADMSMEGMAKSVKAILDKEAISSCIMIGHSMGGYITLAFAELFPASLIGFGLFHSSAFADNDEKKATRQKGIAFIQEHGAVEFLKTSTPNLFATATKDERPELIDKQIAGLNNFLPAALVSYYEAMMQRPDRTSLLKSTHLPVLFVMGKYDNAVPLADGLKQCHLPEKSYIHILQHSGHMGMLEEAANSNHILEKFITETLAD